MNKPLIGFGIALAVLAACFLAVLAGGMAGGIVGYLGGRQAARAALPQPWEELAPPRKSTGRKNGHRSLPPGSGHLSRYPDLCPHNCVEPSSPRWCRVGLQMRRVSRREMSSSLSTIGRLTNVKGYQS